MEQFEAKESSNVGWARYYPERGELEVDFKNKEGARVSTYIYDGTVIGAQIGEPRPALGFPRDVWEQFKVSDSKGRFFAYAIRPKFRGVKKA